MMAYGNNDKESTTDKIVEAGDQIQKAGGEATKFGCSIFFLAFIGLIIFIALQ